MYTEKQIKKITGAIIACFEAQFFLEQCKHLGVFKQRAKLNLNRTLKDLLDIEENIYNKVEQADDKNMADKLVANKLEFINWLLEKFDFSDYAKIQEVCVAFSISPDEITKVSDQILIKNGGKTVE